MTDADIIAHWHKGASDDLEAAKLLQNSGLYESALFHCHLAVEKALKAVYMRQRGEDHPVSMTLHTSQRRSRTHTRRKTSQLCANYRIS